MRTAIYYPHPRPISIDVFRSALLLWDEVEFIVPWHGFQPENQDRDVAEIFELIGRESVPSEEAQKLAHERIEEFATRQLPETFRYSDQHTGAGANSYYMYARKLLPETWDMLSELQLAGRSDGRTSSLRDETGLMLMSILTDCCAGEQKARMTDRSAAYANLSNILVDEENSAEANESIQDCIVPVALGVVNAQAVPLRDLVALRKREAKSSGNDLRRLRQRYRARIEQQIKLLTGTTRADDRRELQRVFEIEMRDDIDDLKSELNLARREAFTSKEVIFLGLATLATGLLASKGLNLPLEHASVGGTVPLLAGGLHIQSKYAQARRAIISRHPMAYMLELDQSPRFSQMRRKSAGPHRG